MTSTVLRCPKFLLFYECKAISGWDTVQKKTIFIRMITHMYSSMNAVFIQFRQLQLFVTHAGCTDTVVI